MTVDELLQVLRERDAVLYVDAGRLKYKGPRRAPDDPIRAAIDAHRAELIALSSVSRPAIRPAGRSDKLGRETLEPVPDQPNRWREPEASSALCVFCPAPLAEGDPIACAAHRERLSVTPIGVTAPVAVTSSPAIGREDLLAIAALRGWEALPFRPGEAAGGSEQAWRTFCGWARGETLRLVLAAVWERWRETVEQYGQVAAPAAPESRRRHDGAGRVPRQDQARGADRDPAGRSGGR